MEVALGFVLLCRFLGVLSPSSSGVGYVELGKHVTGRQSHALKVLWVPCAEDHSAVVGAVAQLVDDFGQLVDALAGVVCLSIDILCAKVPPLEAVDGAQVADVTVGEPHAVEELAGTVAVPDLDADVAEGGGGGVALDEPEELGDDGAEEDSLCGEQGEDGAAVVVELEFEAGGSEDGQGAGTGAVIVGLSVCFAWWWFFATAVLGGCSYRSGLRSPWSRISRTRLRYWCSSCTGVDPIFVSEFVCDCGCGGMKNQRRLL